MGSLILIAPIVLVMMPLFGPNKQNRPISESPHIQFELKPDQPYARAREVMIKAEVVGKVETPKKNKGRWNCVWAIWIWEDGTVEYEQSPRCFHQNTPPIPAIYKLHTFTTSGIIRLRLRDKDGKGSIDGFKFVEVEELPAYTDETEIAGRIE